VKTEYRYLKFEEKPSTGKTKIYLVKAVRDGAVLGHIKWYNTWRQYCFFPVMQTLYNKSCLEDVVHFIDQLANERKLEGKKVS